MTAITLLFPHQLFQNHEILETGNPIYLIEESLFFKQYNFHQTKIAFHRASMKYYADFLCKKGHQVHYVDSVLEISEIKVFITQKSKEGIRDIYFINPVDHWLEKRIQEASKISLIKLHRYETSNFITPTDELGTFFKPEKKKFFHATFYKQQRLKHQVLLNTDKSPIGGKWSFDTENRKKYPAKQTPPNTYFPEQDAYWKEAIDYVKQYYADNLGAITLQSIYPHTHKKAEDWLQNFFTQRFYAFGDYEDAISPQFPYLHHSILTPMLNVGLLNPKDILDKALDFGAKHNIPMNSLEGFVRQIIGWREFIRGMYHAKGTYSRTQNYWGFTRKIPMCFYNGTTGMPPVDDAIKEILKHGYCHHIERLMVLGNFMLLCEFDPDEVYKWFMELFIDAYDWVMVPNVYGMSQFADGGLFATKPYISSSNYILKMSHYKKGDWQKTWDGLFWHFMDKQQAFFRSNPRLSMLVRNLDKMEIGKREGHLKIAKKYLDAL